MSPLGANGFCFQLPNVIHYNDLKTFFKITNFIKLFHNYIPSCYYLGSTSLVRTCCKTQVGRLFVCTSDYFQMSDYTAVVVEFSLPDDFGHFFTSLYIFRYNPGYPQIKRFLIEDQVCIASSLRVA